MEGNGFWKYSLSFEFPSVRGLELGLVVVKVSPDAKVLVELQFVDIEFVHGPTAQREDIVWKRCER